MDDITKQVEWIKERNLGGNDQLLKMMTLIEQQEQALAEKDHELQQIREHEFQAGLNEGLAQVEHLTKALKNIIECEEQWTRHDMVREAKQALKERDLEADPFGDVMKQFYKEREGA